MAERLKQGSLKGTIIKVMSIGGYSMDILRIQSTVERELGKSINTNSLRGALNKLVDQGYLQRTGRGEYKATIECIEGNVYGPMSEQTLQHALGTKSR